MDVYSNGKKFSVDVDLEDGVFITRVKKLVLAELKENYDGFDNAKAGYLTFFKQYSANEGFAEVIEEEEPTFPRKFYASLIIPEAKEEKEGMTLLDHRLFSTLYELCIFQEY